MSLEQLPDPQSRSWTPLALEDTSKLLDDRDNTLRYIIRLEIALEAERRTTQRLYDEIDARDDVERRESESG